MAKLNCIVFLMLISVVGYAQTGIISGTIKDLQTGEILPFVSVAIQNTTTGTISDENGAFKLENLSSGYFNLQFSYIGYKTKIESEIEVFNHKPVILEITMQPDVNTLDEVVIRPKVFVKPVENPNSIRSLGITEIKRSPGSGQDISRVIQTLPGVASSPASNRNDIIVRGGGPSENQFFVDDFEVNAINHFTTQGASGGVWGIIDANHLRNFDLSTGAFPIYADNALSSVFDLDLKKGNTEKFETQINLGTLQRGLNVNGHVGKTVSFLAGVRQANFDLLFADRPIIPKFTDAIVKMDIDLTSKASLSIFAVSAIDNLDFNTDVELTDENLYALERVRKIDQTTYTLGSKLSQQWKNGISKLIYSHNSLQNTVTKYMDNDESKQKILDYFSNETAHRFDLKNTFYFRNVKFTNGLLYKYQKYDVTNKSFQVGANGIVPVEYTNVLSINHYGFYGAVSLKLFSEKLEASVSVRADASDYSDAFSNPFEHLSPRFAFAYSISDAFKVNGSYGIYFQNPSLTSLGFVENGELVNRNTLKPISNTQYVIGGEYQTKFDASFSLEGFYKNYKNYPFSVNNQISLANLSAGFGVFGDEALESTSEGRSYGFEFFYQQKLFKNFYGMLSYTWVNSEFTNGSDEFIASSWDYRHILSATIGKRFNNNWEIGAKWVYYGGIPYTPYDLEASALIENWDLKNRGILDYTQLNSERTTAYHQLDVRVDKKFFFGKWSLNIFADIQNVYNYVGGMAPDLILDRDANYQPQINPENPNAYLTKYADEQGYGIRPNVGVIVEF